MAENSGRKDVRKPSMASWREIFLAELAATSNVSAAARKAGISTGIAYEARRTDAEFNRQWQQAVCEGYDLLEMELLHRLRAGEAKPPSGAKRGGRSFDNAAAVRQLALHRESAMRQRAMRDHEDTEEIIIAINAKLGKMRERRLAAADRAHADGPDGTRRDA